jgi:hypothetical protein
LRLWEYCGWREACQHRFHCTHYAQQRTGRVPINHSIEIGGIAFAGNRGIQKVEVSIDGGISWNPTKLDPSLSQDSWVLWSWPWTPGFPGQYTIVARATDGTGQVQPSQKQGTVPNGATGYHTVVVQVG